jgi:hypothetical protein
VVALINRPVLAPRFFMGLAMPLTTLWSFVACFKVAQTLKKGYCVMKLNLCDTHNIKYSGNQIEKNEMGGACSAYG